MSFLMEVKSLNIKAKTQSQIIILLFVYHLLFTIMGYFLRIQRGTSDAHLYWGVKLDLSQHSWLDFASYGTDFILFLNYPFIRLGLPFWFGFLMYGIIGFFGILKWMDWITLVFGDKFLIKGCNFLPIVFFLPNLHVWTSILGKEALVFWGIASVFYAVAKKKYNSFSFMAGGFLILVIRPHVALMLLTSWIIIFLLDFQIPLKKKLVFFLALSTLCWISIYMVLQLSQIRYWDWARIKRYNDYSILSFNESGSYVPMLEYSFPYRIFSFNFRPLFFDAKGIFQYLASAENTFILLLMMIAFVCFLKYYRKINLTQWVKFALIFTMISSLLFIQRYANLGIFMRTKMMFQPFMVIALLYIIREGMSITSIKILNGKK